MSFYVEISNVVNQKSYVENFKYMDSKGRTIGCNITIYECDLIETNPEKTGTTFCYPAGHYYVARIQATRNNEKFGCFQPNMYFTDPLDRYTYIQKRIVDSMNSAKKKSLKNI